MTISGTDRIFFRFEVATDLAARLSWCRQIHTDIPQGRWTGPQEHEGEIVSASIDKEESSPMAKTVCCPVIAAEQDA
jgi:hypothetical protein